MRPRFSVVIAVHNEAEIVGRCVAGVLAQTLGDLEVVVVDGGCSDPTIDVVRSLADRRVRILGPVEQPVVTGLRRARGSFLTLLEAEDEVHPGWLARLGRLADATAAGVVSCGGEHHHHDGSVTAVRPTTDDGLGHPVSLRPGAIAVRRDLLAATDASADFARRCADAVRHAEDRGLAVVATPEPLVRWNDRRALRPVRDDELVLHSSLQAIDALARSPIPDPDRLAQYATVAGIAAVRAGEHRRARRLLRVARSARPDVAKHWARWLVACVPPLASRVWMVDIATDGDATGREPGTTGDPAGLDDGAGLQTSAR